MPHIIGVKFRNGGKSYYFSPGPYEVVQGDHVVVETSRGVEYGLVSYDLGEMNFQDENIRIKEILRKATDDDDKRATDNRRKEKEAYPIAQDKIMARGLEMKLIDVEYTFDNSKVLFYFTADGRIDFRELVKDLAAVFRARIELRQIGVRDETKMLGGLGICGRTLCCHAYLTDFAPVSIKMAKEQGLSLNPGKISGVCGRLMCCLNNEEEVYEEINARIPHQGDLVTANDGVTGDVVNVNILRERVRVLVEQGGEKEYHEYAVSDLVNVIPRKKRGGKNIPEKEKPLEEEEPVTADELKELEEEETLDAKERGLPGVDVEEDLQSAEGSNHKQRFANKNRYRSDRQKKDFSYKGNREKSNGAKEHPGKEHHSYGNYGRKNREHTGRGAGKYKGAYLHDSGENDS